jgi:hypothetical protein
VPPRIRIEGKESRKKEREAKKKREMMFDSPEKGPATPVAGRSHAASFPVVGVRA